MSSFITTDAKKVLLDKFRTSFDSDRYYIGISGSEVTSNSGGLFDQNRVRNELNFVKVVSNKSFVVDNNTWTSGVTYNAYDDNDPDQEKFYVINSENEVFICLQQGKDNDGTVRTSTVEPTTELAIAFDALGKSFRTSDRYIWRYLYQLTSFADASFKTLSYLPVSKITDTFTTVPASQEQLTLQNGSVAGQILNIQIDSSGTGYDFAPRITIGGNGSGASFSCDIAEGRISRVYVDSSAGSLTHGSGYEYASLEVSGSGGAVLRAVLGPKEGINADPVESLRSNKFMVYTEIQDDENGTIPLADPVNDFKHVALMRNITKYSSDSDFTANTGNAMHNFDISNRQNGDFVVDETFTQTDQTASGKVYWRDNNKLYYVQNHTTGFGDFQVTQGIRSTSGVTATIDVINNPDIDRYSGDILYINNLDEAIDRTSSQTEDIKIVIDLG